jgi:hypothetical protein
MELRIVPASGGQVVRPWYAWLAAAAAVASGVLAIPVGWLFISDPTGVSMGLPPGWIEATVFGTYLIPGLYLLVMNGAAMLLLAGLVVRRHWAAPWLAGVLGVGMIIWIAVQLVVMPEMMILQPIFLGVGLLLGLVALFWLRRTGQLRIW